MSDQFLSDEDVGIGSAPVVDQPTQQSVPKLDGDVGLNQKPQAQLSDADVGLGEHPAEDHPTAAKRPDWQTNLASFATGVGKAVPFGQDIPAAIGATLAEYTPFGPKSVTSDGDWRHKFVTAKKAQERAYDVLGKEAPNSQNLGIATGIVGTLNPLSRAAAIEDAIAQGATRALPSVVTRALPKAAPAAIRGATGVGSNAAIGAAYGLGEGNSLDERLENAKTGALIGGTAGAAIPAAGAAIGKGVSSVRDVFPSITNRAENAATRKIANVMRRETERLTPEEVAAAQERGQPILPLDVGGSKLRTELGEGLKQSGEEVKDTVQNTLRDRELGRQSRAEDYIKSIMKDPQLDAAQTVEQLRDLANRVNAPAYQEAYQAGSNGVWNEGLANLMNSPTMRRAAKPALEKSANQSVLEGKPLLESPFTFNDAGEAVGLKEGQTPTLEFWDHVKRSLDDQIGGLRRSGQNDEAMGAQKLRNALVGHLDAAVPEYATARENASRLFDADNSFDAGLNFLGKGSAMDTAASSAALSRMSDAERELFAHGVSNDILHRVRSGEDLSKLFGTPTERQKLELALGPEKARNIEAFTRIEDLMSKAHRHIVGSGVNPKQFANNGHVLSGLGKDALAYELAGHYVMGGGLTGLAIRRGLSHLAGVLGKNTTEAMAKRLISDDPAAMQEVLGIIASNPKAMNRLRQITQTASAVAPELGSYQHSHQGDNSRMARADGGKVCYPAKAMTRMERSLARAQKAIAEQTKPIMDLNDSVVAHALEIASTK